MIVMHILRGRIMNSNPEYVAAVQISWELAKSDITSRTPTKLNPFCLAFPECVTTVPNNNKQNIYWKYFVSNLCKQILATNCRKSTAVAQGALTERFWDLDSLCWVLFFSIKGVRQIGRYHQIKKELQKIINHHSMLLNPLHCALYNLDLNRGPRDNQPSLGSACHGVSPRNIRLYISTSKNWQCGLI